MAKAIIIVSTWDEESQQYVTDTVEYEATSLNTPQHEEVER